MHALGRRINRGDRTIIDLFNALSSLTLDGTDDDLQPHVRKMPSHLVGILMRQRVRSVFLQLLGQYRLQP
jgi:hypothetical protein